MTPEERRLLDEARRAVLATVAPDGVPRLVPVCFVVLDGPRGPIVYSPLDEKPKRTGDPRALARVRDIVARPEVALLVDRWSEDWSELVWIRANGAATLLEPTGGRPPEEHGSAVAALRAKYAQYHTQRLEQRPLLRITLDRVVSWSSRPTGD